MNKNKLLNLIPKIKEQSKSVKDVLKETLEQKNVQEDTFNRAIIILLDDKSEDTASVDITLIGVNGLEALGTLWISGDIISEKMGFR